ncbi:uncharacterized protein LOC125237152 [Leguminivora glycinivorella]|uniref:uncharacterized protein LOC125237152 n=1 Tax=Leguminivora glycinivorella TaxID=1035111 RepID=UPI00200D7B88|nr:uncharacterized protein LOC125237152 [Leguminivora glycinivorella]
MNETEYEPLAFTYKNTKHLIQLVQARPCLWDRNAPDYKDRLARDRAWAQIFEDLAPQYKQANATAKHDLGITIMKKWYNIRDSYVKSLKPDYLGRRNRPYIHAELLRFLDDCYLEKINTSFPAAPKRNPEDYDEIETEQQDAEETEPWDQKVFVTLEEDPPQKRPRTEYPEIENRTNEDDIIAVLSNLIQREEDEDRSFFKSITPSVKKLSENSKIEFRIEVLKLIKKLRAKDNDDSKLEESENDSESE